MGFMTLGRPESGERKMAMGLLERRLRWGLSFKGRMVALLVFAGPGPTSQVGAAVEVTDRQGVATLAVAQSEPAFEVHRPDVVGVSRDGERAARHFVEARLAPGSLTQPIPAQDPGNRAASRRSTTALAQARGTFLTVAFSPLVAGLPADAEIRAQLREREAARGRETDELMLLSH